MQTSESQINLIAALLAAQGKFPAIDQDQGGQAGNRKFKYAPLEEIKALCDPILWERADADARARTVTCSSPAWSTSPASGAKPACP
jgi:hypothetical protein